MGFRVALDEQAAQVAIGAEEELGLLHGGDAGAVNSNERVTVPRRTV